ncbi:MAG: MoaD/ThiS family protein [Chloroflexi bacterium]|jgi:sulfur carrier protein ThiS|nr:MoaD/ThiS family protein [Chloroflexota bacterium]
MKVRVKLYGTLSERLTPDERSDGIEVEIPEGATARDLLGLLGISEPRGGVVVVDGRVLGVDDEIRCGAAVSVFQAIGGG